MGGEAGMGHETRLKDEDKTEDVESFPRAQHLGKRISRRPRRASRSRRARALIHGTREKTNTGQLERVHASSDTMGRE
jgi:hypothetical protein